MTAWVMLERLRDADIALTLDGDELRVRGPKQVLTDELREEIATSRAAIVAALSEVSIVRVTDGGTTGSAPRQMRWWITLGEVWPSWRRCYACRRFVEPKEGMCETCHPAMSR